MTDEFAVFFKVKSDIYLTDLAIRESMKGFEKFLNKNSNFRFEFIDFKKKPPTPQKSKVG